MPNPAKTDFGIHPLLKNRYSPRSFLDKSIAPDTLRRIFEAARWSPSCNNDQEWFYIVGIRGQGPDFDRIVSVLRPNNQTWASKASVLMIVCGRTTFTGGTTPNKYHAYDSGQSAAHLTFQAASEGVSVHQMAGFDPDKTRTEFSVPDGFVPLTAVAMGYAGDASMLPEALAKRETAERTRRPQKEFVFGGTWGKPLD
ncbi:MAG TPA: nitroreductase family protein [Chitinivibrionales bacterium]|nr:nitroreductase family protein [Chitinivibrionales bacterium]